MIYDVVVVGAAGLDTCVYLASGQDITTDVTFTTNRDGVGQAGGYAAQSYAALGYSTGYYGAIGDDPAGRQVRDDFNRAGIDTSTCFLDPLGTARSVNIVTPDGQRRGCYDGRGNPSLHIDTAVATRLLRHARLCHVNIPNWAREILPIARAAGCTIISDLQDVADPHDPYRIDFVHGSDIIAFSCARDLDPDTTIRAYWALNPELIQIAGMGAHGCTVGYAGTITHHPAPVSDLAILDTNGAGDTLAAVTAAGIALAGTDPDTAASQAQRAARMICGQLVPKRTFATWSDVRPTAAEEADEGAHSGTVGDLRAIERQA